MHELDAGQRALRCFKRLEPQHRARHPLDGSMVLFHDIIQIFHLPDDDVGAVRLIVALDGRVIGRTPIDRDRLRDPVTVARLRQKAERGLGISVLGEQKVDGLPGRIHRSIQVSPLAFDPNGGLVQAPAAPDRALAAMEGLFQQGTVLHDPALDGRMVEQHPTLFHEFLHMPIAQGVRHIPPYTHQNNIPREMGPFEAHRHRLSPSLATTDHEGRSYRKSPYMKTRDRTLAGPPGAIGEKFTVSQQAHDEVSYEQRPLYLEKQLVVQFWTACTYGCTAILLRTIGTCERDPRLL